MEGGRRDRRRERERSEEGMWGGNVEEGLRREGVGEKVKER